MLASLTKRLALLTVTLRRLLSRVLLASLATPETTVWFQEGILSSCGQESDPDKACCQISGLLKVFCPRNVLHLGTAVASTVVTPVGVATNSSQPTAAPQ